MATSQTAHEANTCTKGPSRSGVAPGRTEVASQSTSQTSPVARFYRAMPLFWAFSKNFSMSHMLTSPEVNAYAEKMSTAESSVLNKLNRETHLKIELPVMLSGHLQGAVLTMLSNMIRPRRILEIGTYTGYSAICLAQGLTDDGVLHTIDINEELEEMCRRYWAEAGVADKIRFHIGKAAEIIPQINEVFDLVFIDADKQGYAAYYDLVFDKVRPGGFIFADNVLYDGEVLLPEESRSKNAKAIDAFNQKIHDDPRVSQVLLPIRDGILMIQKL